MHAGLRGDATPKIGQPVTFTLALINHNGRACVLKRTPATVELKIYSGTDRIWSTDDCAKLVAPTSQLVKVASTVTWKVAWDGRRSAAGCGHRSGTPRAGTYFATFQFSGAKPTQQRMILRSS